MSRPFTTRVVMADPVLRFLITGVLLYTGWYLAYEFLIHPNGALADAFAKAVLLMGSERGLHWLGGQWNAAGMLVRADGRALATDRFTTFIATEGEREYEVIA